MTPTLTPNPPRAMQRTHPMDTRDLMALSPVIPVVVLPEVGQAVPVARALAAGGVGVIEVTLRTEAGLESVRRIAAEVGLPTATVAE